MNQTPQGVEMGPSGTQVVFPETKDFGSPDFSLSEIRQILGHAVQGDEMVLGELTRVHRDMVLVPAFTERMLRRKKAIESRRFGH